MTTDGTHRPRRGGRPPADRRHPRRRPGGRRRRHHDRGRDRLAAGARRRRAPRARPGSRRPPRCSARQWRRTWLARVMSRRGRRVGQVTGLLLGAAGAALAVVAGVIGSMALLLVGAGLLGFTSAANAAARYAATDLAPAGSRARSLSLVVWATTVGAVVGPNLTGPGGALADWLGIPELTGPFALAAIGMLAGGRGDRRLHAPRPAAARARARRAPTRRRRRGRRGDGRVAALRASPPLAAAVARAGERPRRHGVGDDHDAAAHGARRCRAAGHRLRDPGHVLGMFAFSPVMGWLADRWGRPAMLLAGAGVQLLVAAAGRRLAGGLVLADLRRPVPARPRLVRGHRGRLGHDRRPGPAGVAHRRAGRRRHGDVADRRRGRRALRADRRRAGATPPSTASPRCSGRRCRPRGVVTAAATGDQDAPEKVGA